MTEPCPFCKSAKTTVGHGLTKNTWAMRCLSCGALGPQAYDAQTAADKWSKRCADTKA